MIRLTPPVESFALVGQRHWEVRSGVSVTRGGENKQFLDPLLPPTYRGKMPISFKNTLDEAVLRFNTVESGALSSWLFTCKESSTCKTFAHAGLQWPS